MRIVVAAILLLLVTSPALAQEFPGRHRDVLTPEAGPTYPLKSILIPGSVSVEANGSRLDASLFAVDVARGIVAIEPSVLDTTLDLVVSYRTVPLTDGRTFTYAESDTSRSADALSDVVAARASRPAAGDPFEGVAIQRSGSITRGITAGSNRDVGLESGLQLELAGEIADGVAIKAMLSDENTPILPEGTTRRLDEIDRVFIEVESPLGTARLGDVDYRTTETSFARVTRKVQGVAVSSEVKGQGATFAGASINATGAISRGQFRSQVIDVEDGIQGPYRLRGSRGEHFLLVIPGSERVYWDGQLLERGESRDYRIDYATAEITFTANRLVTDDRRVLVEFEYSANQFTRSLIASQAEARFWEGRGGPKLLVGGAVVREADGSGFIEEFGLTSADSLLLAGAGDGMAVRSGAEPVTFDPEAPYVQYVARDTTISGVSQTVYAAITSRPGPDQVVYRVRFSHVGAGEGSYERAGQSLNGVQYVFRGPGQGSYDPVRILPGPSAQRLVDVYGRATIFPGLELFGEWARSVHDRNRLSALDADDDAGGAFEGGLNLQPLSLGHSVELSGGYRRRVIGASFSAFDRIRPVDFGRHWNLSSRATAADAVSSARELTDEATINLRRAGIGDARFEAGRISLADWFAGRRYSVAGQALPAGLPRLEYRGEWISSQNQLERIDGRWNRHYATIAFPIKANRLLPAVNVEHEDRRQHIMGGDSLGFESFRFTRISPNIAWRSDDLEASADLTFRTDEQWMDGALEHAYDAWTASSGIDYAGTRLSVDARVGLRRREFSETFREREGRADQTTLVVRSGMRWRPLRRGIDVLASYEANSERTPLLQEIFVRTGPEMGQFVWEDLNGDEVIQLDEMIPERTPNEGVYGRTYLPTDSLISSVSVRARSELRVDGDALWRDADGWRRLLAHVATRSTFEVHESTRDDDLARIYLLDLSRFRNPETTITGRARMAQSVSLWPRSRIFGIDADHSRVHSLNNRTMGEEAQSFAVSSAEARWMPASPVSLLLRVAKERSRQLSQQFETRRFDISSRRLEPEVVLRLGRQLRLSAPTAFAWKNDSSTDQRAVIVRLPLEVRYEVPRRLSWTSRFEVANVKMTGGSRGLAEFELTDGRGPGVSTLWTSTARYSINDYLSARLQYDARSPYGAPVVHTLRMQLSAIF